MIIGTAIVIIMIIITIIYIGFVIVYGLIKDALISSINSMVLGVIVLCAAWLGIFGLQFVKSEKDITYYNTCIENDYTVYLNGKEVQHPDKLDIEGYYITFDDEKKEIILNK